MRNPAEVIEPAIGVAPAPQRALDPGIQSKVLADLHIVA